MIKGVFIENMPFVRVVLGWGRLVQAPFVVLDTGFTGDLQVTPRIARELGLVPSGVTPVRLANNQVVNIPTALAIASMEGSVNYIQVLIAESIPLAGISFLSKFFYKAIVNCKYKTVILERAI